MTMAQHHVQVLVSRESFFNNIQYLRRLIAPSKICVVMKANAYGHGLDCGTPAHRFCSFPIDVQSQVLRRVVQAEQEQLDF